MKVIATDKFKKRKVRPAELKDIPLAGTEFEVTEERYNVLFSKGYVEETKTSKEVKEVKKVEKAKEVTE